MRIYKAASLLVALFCLSLPLPAIAQGTTSLATLDAGYWSTHVDLSDQNVRNLTQAQISGLVVGPAFITGAVADGATKVLLRCITLSPGTVTFTAAGRIVGDNLRKIDSLQPPINVATRPIGGTTKNVAYAIYTVPQQLNRGEKTHAITFGAIFTPMCDCGQPIVTAPLTLYRPPVVLIHGLWSDAGTWINTTGTLNALDQAGFNSYLCDYKRTNNQSLATNQFVPYSNPAGIFTAYGVYRGRKIAITRVDIVAHSMGGLITRNFATWVNYRSINNYCAGYVRRFITMGTPHAGSPIATILNIAVTTRYGGIVLYALQKAGMPYGPALVDLQPGSAALRRLGTTPIPCYAEIGVYISGSTGALATLYNALSFFGYDNIFGGELSDLIVGVSSQQGGIPGLFTTTTTDTTHLDETSATPIANDVVRLLSGDIKYLYAPGFPPSGTPPPPAGGGGGGGGQAVPGFDPLIAAPTSPPFISITSPTSGQVFQPGDDMDVTVTPNSGVDLQQVLVIASANGVPFGSAVLTSPPYTADIPIPTDEDGDVDISAIAEDTSGDMCDTDQEASIQPSATVQSLLVSTENEMPTPITLTSQGSTLQLDVIGQFSDSVQRDITDGSTGTQYNSDNSGAATVSPDGLVTAVGNGTANITVSNGAASTVVPIVVSFGVPQILSTDPTVVAAGATVPLNLVGTDLGGASQVQFLLNGVPDPNILVSGLQNDDTDGGTLSATMTVNPGTMPGSRTVVVTTPGGQSDPNAAPDAVTFTVVAPPAISSLDPASVLAGGPGFTLTVSGMSYLNGASVLWNGSPLATTVVSAHKLTAAVPAALIASPDTANITVTLDGGVSNSKTETILLTDLSVAGASLSRDPSTQAITATVSLQNLGFNTAPGVEVAHATLSSKTTTTSLPLLVGDIAAGSTGTVVLNFPKSTGVSGASATLSLSGTFTGGVFKGSLPVTLP